MFLSDYIGFLKEIIQSEKENVKRLLKIIVMGSFLIFFVSLFSSLIKLKIDTTYAGRYVLLPYLKNQQEYDHTLSLKLMDESVKNDIENKYDNTRFIDQGPLKEITLQNITQQQSASLTYEINVFDEYIYLGDHILELYKWKLNDFYTIDSTVIQLDDTINTGIDLLLPKSFEQDTYVSEDHLLTLQTSSDIDEILQDINHQLLSPLYEYRLEDFSMDELLIAIVGSVEKILLLFSFLIFSVSSSNIGTVMPYFVNEFKDEINLLCLMGLSKDVIFYIFMMASVFILSFALIISLLMSYGLYILFAFALSVTLKFPLFRIFALFIFQLVCGCIFSFQSIKKATHEVTYL